MSKQKKQFTQKKEKPLQFGFHVSYASNVLTDSDGDNSFEIDNYVYNDPQVIEAVDYLVNMTLSNAEFENEEQEKNYNLYKHQLSMFLIQYIVEGFSAIIDMKTLKNSKIKKKIFDGKNWHILYKTTVYNTFDDKEDVLYAISDKKFLKGIDYDKYINNKYLVVRKNHIIRMEQLKSLVNLKNEVIDILNIAIKKNAIPTLIMKTDVIDDELKNDMLSFLEGYKNSSASVVNSDLVHEIVSIDAKPNEDLIFNTISLINSEIGSLLGVSNTILVSPRSFAYSTTNAIVSIVNRHVNHLKELMEGVMLEISEKNNIDLKVKLPKIYIDDFVVENQTIDNQSQSTDNGDK